MGGGGETISGTMPGTYKFIVDGAYTPNASTSTEPLFYSTPQVFVEREYSVSVSEAKNL
jgi:hypothetical protein